MSARNGIQRALWLALSVWLPGTVTLAAQAPRPDAIAVAFALKAAGWTQPAVQEAIPGAFTLNLQQVAEIRATVF
ncbi:MAG TPA: hypothetical protein VMM79_08270 [Longimicrobiales bacterium]|nr:hypothetical protein [Longimicrobiales bacterium]